MNKNDLNKVEEGYYGKIIMISKGIVTLVFL